MKVIFACAGTGGHINPAIAIAGIILKNKPIVNNYAVNIYFITTKNRQNWRFLSYYIKINTLNYKFVGTGVLDCP